MVFSFAIIVIVIQELLEKEKKSKKENLVNEIEKTKLRMSEVNEELSLIRSELQNAGLDTHEGKRP